MLRMFAMRLASKVSGMNVAGRVATEHPVLASNFSIAIMLPNTMRIAPGLGSQMLRRAASTMSPASRVATPRAYQYEAPSGGMQAASIEIIDFDPAKANSVSLMGTVGRKPELKYLENGNKVASYSLAFSDKKDAPTQWFDVEAWGALADMVAAEVDKGNRIVVEGRLRVNAWVGRDNVERKSLRIVANSVKKVRTDSAYGKTNTINNRTDYESRYSQPQQQQQQSSYAAPAAQLATVEEHWMNFFEDPSGWYDNRSRKQTNQISSKSPDFKKIEGGQAAPALWIDSRSTPAWVQQELKRQEQAIGGQDQPPF